MARLQQDDAVPRRAQVDFWNDWNSSTREINIDRVSSDQRGVVLAWLEELGCSNADIIDVGCGAGWLCPSLTRFGQITGTDLSDQVLKRAADRFPAVRFVAGDFETLDFGEEVYDVAVSLEVLSHVADQPGFISKLASLLRPGGYLMLATQNRPQLERNDIPSPKPGQIRRWVDSNELRQLLEREFEVEQLFSITPQFNRGFLRIVNSCKVHALLSSVGLRGVSRRVKEYQERRGLGWTLMVKARKRASA